MAIILIFELEAKQLLLPTLMFPQEGKPFLCWCWSDSPPFSHSACDFSLLFPQPMAVLNSALWPPWADGDVSYIEFRWSSWRLESTLGWVVYLGLYSICVPLLVTRNSLFACFWFLFKNLLSFLWYFALSSVVRVNLRLLILSELNCVEHDKSKCYLVHSTCITLTILSSPVDKERTEGKWRTESHIFSLENKHQPYNELAIEGRMGSIKIHMLQTHVPRTPKLMNWGRQIGQVRLSDSVVFGLEGWFHS